MRLESKKGAPHQAVSSSRKALSHATHQIIVAVATPPGRGAIGIVRLSGKGARRIAGRIARLPAGKITPRHATYTGFYDADGEMLDKGLLLFFPAPHSFTGEDQVEFHMHGNPILLHNLKELAISLGAEQAQPGEFSRRAYLNGKMDLSQAEAIADLINSDNELALRASLASMQGAFSKEVRELDTQLMQLRVYVEAALDFPEEEIDFLNDGEIERQTSSLLENLERVHKNAQQGQQLTEERQVVILGKPNAGKSSLLNALCRQERAIVDAAAGTTRDFIRQSISTNGISLSLIDTAGIRSSSGGPEHKGIQQSWRQAELADKILFIYDGRQGASERLIGEFSRRRLLAKIIPIENKTDLTTHKNGVFIAQFGDQRLRGVRLSAKTGKGLDALIKLLSATGETAPTYSARRRHVLLLEQTKKQIIAGHQALKQMGAGELFAEELKKAQETLGEVTGNADSDALLDNIFAEFCIGK